MLAEAEGLAVALIYAFSRLTLLWLIEQVGPAPTPRAGQGRGTDGVQ